jgi:hypothetical protein
MRDDDLLSKNNILRCMRRVEVIKADGVPDMMIQLSLDPIPNTGDWQYEEDADVLYETLKASLPIATWEALAGRFHA